MSAPANHIAPSPRRAFDQRVALALLGCDLVACLAAILIAYGLRATVLAPVLSPLRHELWMYLTAYPVVALLWVMTFHAQGLYELRRHTSAAAELTATVRAATLTVLLVAGASFLSHTDYSRAMLFLFWGAATCLSVVLRGVVRRRAELVRIRGGACGRTLIVGVGDLARLVAERVRAQGVLGYELVGFVSVTDAPASVAGLPVVGNIAELPDLVRQHGVNDVLVARPDIEPSVLMSAVQACEGLPVEFHVVAGPLEVLIENVELSALAGLPVIALPQRSFRPWELMIKRALDLVVASLLLVVLAPLLLLVAWWVRRDTGASAIFRQTRIGYRGRPFVLLKFRTMRPETNPYEPSPRDPGDPRVTPFGRFLRRWSLDELPQLINIVRGDMSLVGPRPEMPFVVEQYEPWQRQRLNARPGMTGLWQILGRKDLPLHQNIEVDFYYIRNWSIWLDLAILLRTIPVVLAGRGAY